MSATSSLFSTLLSEFKSRYPMGAIVAELLTVHQGSYVVRALVQLGNISFASGMATATHIEMAEDQAKVRALQAFGISADSHQSTPTLYPDYKPFISTQSIPAQSIPAQSYAELVPLSPDLLPQDLPSQDASLPNVSDFGAESEPNPAIETAIAPVLEPSALTDSAQDLDPVDSTLNFNLELPPLSYPDSAEIAKLSNIELDDSLESPQPLIDLSLPNSEPNLPPAKEKSAKRKSEPKPLIADAPAIAATEVAESGDRSNEIARIGVEMKRLSWTTEQGRGYLKRTYGKRSRQELDDIELLDFLRFLETQPSPSQPLF